jgi:hypothetical protein
MTVTYLKGVIIEIQFQGKGPECPLPSGYRKGFEETGEWGLHFYGQGQSTVNSRLC